MEKDIIKALENRLQFTVVMVLFFPTFLDSLFTYTGIKNNNDFLKTILSWNVTIGLFISIYIILEIFKIRKKTFSKIWISKLTNILLLMEVGSFIPLFLLGAVENIKNTLFVLFYKGLVIGSIFCMIFIPVFIIILFLIVNPILNKYDSRS